MTRFPLQNEKYVEQYRSLQKTKIGKLLCIFCARSSGSHVFLSCIRKRFQIGMEYALKRLGLRYQIYSLFYRKTLCLRVFLFFVFLMPVLPGLLFFGRFSFLKTGAWNVE
ncbi:hypothetical protein OFAG_02167 [Oxalobacter formigenes HOxBLS]|uniref:Uncharacterized protein n=1 Tax=Oxalobacter paraformigenes TaxID=556268 RepID=T5LUV7_9BURK|nr:hypothetical protein OFAG_02167 [Oxalobacter paraformigenes]